MAVSNKAIYLGQLKLIREMLKSEANREHIMFEIDSLKKYIDAYEPDENIDWPEPTDYEKSL